MSRINSKKNITELINWYSEKRSLYQQLSKKVESIIAEIINDEKITIHAIYSRAKEIDSFAKKIEDPKYTDPVNQITDFSGIRVIAYVESDLPKISKVIKDHFEVDENQSIDKSQTLGTDKVGYRSIHFIAKLPKDRIKLPEYKKFNNLYFEIQIRTILQHSWAEIEHDKNYKFSGVLPDELKRRFKVLAGVLELADREFNEIAKEIDSYSAEVKADTKQGKLDISITSASLKSYMNLKFEPLMKKGLTANFTTEDYERKIITELKLFDVHTLKQLDEIIPKDFIENTALHENVEELNYLGILRNVMMITDPEKYFEKSYTGDWSYIFVDNLNLVEIYSSKIKKILKAKKIIIG